MVGSRLWSKGSRLGTLLVEAREGRPCPRHPLLQHGHLAASLGHWGLSLKGLWARSPLKAELALLSPCAGWLLVLLPAPHNLQVSRLLGLGWGWIG